MPDAWSSDAETADSARYDAHARHALGRNAHFWANLTHGKCIGDWTPWARGAYQEVATEEVPMYRYLITTLTLALATPSVALACGGFFCNNLERVDQSGEKIVFAIDEERKVEVHVQIAYTGAAEDFAWCSRAQRARAVLVDRVVVHSARCRHEPSYQLNWIDEGPCALCHRANQAGTPGSTRATSASTLAWAAAAAVAA